MKPELYQRVALRRDVADHRLMRGDVAVLVDRIPHPSGGEPGVVLEVFNAIGESLSVVAVKESDIEPLRADEVLTVRSLPPRRLETGTQLVIDSSCVPVSAPPSGSSNLADPARTRSSFLRVTAPASTVTDGRSNRFVSGF